MTDNKDMQFINHILKNHKYTVVAILGAVVLIGLYLSNQSQAATPYSPATTLNPAEGPGNAFVQIPASQWTTSGENITYEVGLDNSGGNVGISGIDDGSILFYVENGSSDPSASSDIFLNNDGGLSGYLSARSSTYSLFSGEQANRLVLSTYVSTDGLSIVAAKPTDDIKFYTGSAAAANLRMTIEPDGDIGIGTATPTSRFSVGATSQFQVNSTGNLVKLNDVTYSWPASQGGASTVLTNNGSGTLTWAAAGGSGWSLTGNAGTTAGTNFIGTTDNVDLVFKTNNTEAMRIKNSGQINVGVGYNLYIGQGSGAVSDPDVTNLGVGKNTFRVNTSGQNNTALGIESMYSNTTGQSNTAVGADTLYENIVGNANTAVGYPALGNAIGSDNTAIGASTLTNVTGDFNTALGSNAMGSLLTGSNNIGLGWDAGGNITSGSNNIMIGYDVYAPAAATSDYMSIGNLIFATGGFGVNHAIGTGSIGIGTKTPAARFHVSSDSTADNFEIARFTWAPDANGEDAHILIEASSSGRAGYIGFRDHVGSSQTGLFLAGSGDLDTPDLFISETGDVGIGDESPVSKLSIPSLSVTPIGTNVTPAMVCIDDDGGFWKDNDGTFDCQ